MVWGGLWYFNGPLQQLFSGTTAPPPCTGSVQCHYIQLHQHLYRQVILYSSLYKIPNLNSDRIKKMKYSFALKFSFI